MWSLIAVIASARLAWVSIVQSGAVDLHVYWKAVGIWLGGQSPYAFTGNEGVLVFKYPPWTLPFFLPLKIFSFEAWHFLWVPLQLLGIHSAIRWVIRAQVRPDIAYLSAALFWWIWLGHAQAGQIMIFILAASLWAIPPDSSNKLNSLTLAPLCLIISAKVFNSFSLLGFLKEIVRLRTIFLIVVLLAVLNGLVLLPLKLHSNSISLLELYHEWFKAGTSGGTQFAAETIRGQGNHSLTALVLRLLQVPAEDSSKDIWMGAGIGILLSFAWHLAADQLSQAEKWAGWLTLGNVIHPLLWHHSFVLCFPLCALALDRAIQSRSRSLIVSASISIGLIALLIPNLWGVDFVRPFELAGSKSWGAVLASITLVLSVRSLRGVSDSVIAIAGSTMKVNVGEKPQGSE